MRNQKPLRTCRQEPREYPFGYVIPDPYGRVSNIAQKLDQDATFFLREVVPLDPVGYRYQFVDPARMPLQDSPIDPFDQMIEPPVPYPPAGMILLTLEDISGNPNTPVNLLFRGVNQYLDYKEPPKRGHCLEVPKTYFLMVNFAASGIFNDQLVYVDDDAEFALRRVNVSGSVPFTYQFSDRDRSFIQAGLIQPFGGPGVYDPELVYPPGGQIVVNVSAAAPGSVMLAFTGVNRYRVE